MKVYIEDYLLGTCLFLVFIVSELGNILLLLNLCKKKFNNTTVLLLKALTVVTSLSGLFSVLPASISMLHRTWLQNRVLCVLQGVLANMFLTTTSLLLFSFSVDRFIATVRRFTIKQSKTTFLPLQVGIFILSGMTVTGIFVFTMYQYKYIPGSFSCDISIDAFSLTASLGTVVVPCFGCILLNVSTVWKVFTKKEVLPTGSTQQNTTPRQILISVTRSSESSEFKTHPNNQTTGDKDKSSSDATTATNGKHATKSLALLQISMSLVIIISFVIKVVSHRLFPVGDPFLKINLVLTGLSCFVQPTICFITMKPLRLYIKKLFRCQHFEDTYEQAPQLAPLPRSDGFQSTDIPSFLLPTDTKVPTIRVAKKVSDTSAIVLCRIQLGETRPRKNSRVVSSVEIEHKKSVHLQFHVGNESRRESMKNDNGEQSCSTDMDDSVVITTSSTVADKNDPIFVRNEKLCMKFRRQSLSTGNDVSSDKLALSRPSPTSLSEDGAAVSLYFTIPDPDCVRYKKYVTRDIPQAWVQELDQDANPLETQALDDGTEINNIFPTEEVEQY